MLVVRQRNRWMCGSKYLSDHVSTDTAPTNMLQRVCCGCKRDATTLLWKVLSRTNCYFTDRIRMEESGRGGC